MPASITGCSMCNISVSLVFIGPLSVQVSERATAPKRSILGGVGTESPAKLRGQTLAAPRDHFETFVELDVVAVVGVEQVEVASRLDQITQQHHLRRLIRQP